MTPFIPVCGVRQVTSMCLNFMSVNGGSSLYREFKFNLKISKFSCSVCSTMSHTDMKKNNTEGNRKEKNTEQLVMADMANMVGYLLCWI